MMKRDKFLWLAAGTVGATLGLPGCVAKNLPLDSESFPALENQEQPGPWGLVTSLHKEYSYEARVDGRVPEELRGTLYRNGPGLFDRGGLRKRNLLDGDGMIQAFRFHDKGGHFQNKFVQTAKYKEEEAAGKYLYSTWTTQAPGGLFSNLFTKKLRPQAGVSTVMRNGRLYAFDESTLPYELNPDTLETLGLSYLGLPEDSPVVYSAHGKIDGHNGDWIHFGLQYGRQITVHLTIFDKKGNLKKHWTVPLSRYVYIHDFFVSEKHIILNLHPAEISIYGFLFGTRSLVDSFRWKPEEGNLLLILDREGGTEPIRLTTEASWMWHSLNAYEKGDEIIADFVAYKHPDHLIGNNPFFSTIMSGSRGNARYYSGEVRRYIINLKQKRVQQEILNNGATEFPRVNPSHYCHQHCFGYFTKGPPDDEFLPISVARINMNTGKTDSYEFGEGFYCSEPIFASKPNFNYEPNSKEEPGWLLTEVYNSYTKKSFLSVLNADRLSDGPLANIHLEHHVPFSFHGYWHANS